IQNLYRMKRSSTYCIIDLVATGCSGCRNERFLRSCAYRREQYQFSDFHRHIVMLAFVAKRTRHPTTSRRNHLYRIIYRQTERFYSVGLYVKCLLVTMTVQFIMSRFVRKLIWMYMSAIDFEGNTLIDHKAVFRNMLSFLSQAMIHQT